MTPAGDYSDVCSSAGQDGSGDGVYGQHYSAQSDALEPGTFALDSRTDTPIPTHEQQLPATPVTDHLGSNSPAQAPVPFTVRFNVQPHGLGSQDVDTSLVLGVDAAAVRESVPVAGSMASERVSKPEAVAVTEVVGAGLVRWGATAEVSLPAGSSEVDQPGAPEQPADPRAPSVPPADAIGVLEVMPSTEIRAAQRGLGETQERISDRDADACFTDAGWLGSSTNRADESPCGTGADEGHLPAFGLLALFAGGVLAEEKKSFRTDSTRAANRPLSRS
jgi:hypothetical protein